MIKKILFALLAFIFVVGVVNASDTLYEYYNGDLPLLSERAELAVESGIVDEVSLYIGSYEQNKALLSYLEGSVSLFGATQRPSGYKTTLAESLNATASTTEDIKVSSLDTKDGHTLTDDDVGTYIVLTIAPGRGNEEKIACTGGTDSVSNWQTCTRGLNYYNQSTGDATVYAHSPGETVIISDDDAYISVQLGLLTGTNSWSGVNTWNAVNTFNQYPEILSTLGYATTSWQLLTLGQAQALANQGAATSTESVAGISTLATRVQNASSTVFGILDPHVQQSQHSTSTPSANLYTDNIVWDIWTENDGYLNQGFLDLTDDFAFSGDNTYSGNQTFSGTNTLNATTTLNNAITFIDGTVQNFTCGEPIGSNKAVYGYSTSTRIGLGDSTNATSSLNFLGFSLDGCAEGETVAIQTNGLYDTNFDVATNTPYFITTAGNISTSTEVVTYESFVGRAISRRLINMDANIGNQYIGSAADSTDIISVPENVRIAIVDFVASGDASNTFHSQVTLTANGITTQTLQTEGSNQEDLSMSATWDVSANTITLTELGDTTTAIEGTAYFYY